ncbi:MAG: N-acetyltransferase [Rhodospirillales bacterium]|jgi:predicted N-acetyltransferase YhbS|nr:N-acetyltransferase [Rhodospirillales bacterium]MBT4041121.1 N-acetyltransferase [Rhodospirillales bacterium]MBT4626053.1 N-acetyltransferase [Rhodospirillales bacterium]MBT5350731.1 N-acetyltransferase [Rhodospirillales bacterium]MBT5519310.1 N-acetyltransferase [Rhodospirillales bacterium]
MFDIMVARPKDTKPVEKLLNKAFGPNRHEKRSYHFRVGVEDVPTLRFVAVTGGHLCGTIRFWPVYIGASTKALLLGPLGVDPEHQSIGIGADLMTHGMNMARDQGHSIVLLVGELDYYGRFGFGPASPHDITMSGEQDHRVLVRELHNDALEGVMGPVTSLAETSKSAVSAA